MRVWISVWIVVMACGGGQPSAAPTVDDSPTQVEPDAANPFVSRHQALGNTPEGALSVWLQAAMAAGDPQPDTAARGMVALGRLTAPFRAAEDWARRPSYRTFHERLKTHPHVFRSYFKGSSPENGYRQGSELELDVTRSEDAGDRGWRLDVHSSGADSPRPVYLKKNKKNGLFYVAGFDNIYVDIRKPVDPDAEF